MTKHMKIGIVSLFSSVLAANLSAAPIAINDPSFESLGSLNSGFQTCVAIATFQAKGCRTTNNVGAEWTGSFTGGAAAAFQFGVVTPYLTGDPSLVGSAAAYIHGAAHPGPDVPGSDYAFASLKNTNTSVDLSQALAATLQLNTVYTLKVAVGFRAQAALAPAYSVILGTTSGAVLASTGAVALTAGQWTDVTVSYAAIANDPNANQNLRIILRGLSSIETGFDNVRLDAVEAVAPVPEPATMSLIGGSLLGLAAYARKRAARA